MGAEAGNVVARLAVKVTPDTKDFWGDLSRRLDAIERRLQPLEVGVELDENALRERVRVMSERAQAAVKDVEMGVHFDEREFSKINAMADRLDDAMERQSGALSKVYDGDMNTIRQHWSAALDAMKRDAAKKLKFTGPRGDDDTYWRGHTESAFRAWYGRRGEEMRRAFRDLGPVEFELRPDAQWQERVRGVLDGFFDKEYVGKVKWRVDEDLDDMGALRRLRARMEREFSHGWKYVVDPDVDVKSGRVDAALDKLRHEMRERAFGKHEAFHLDIKPHMSDHELREAGRKLKHFKRKWDDTELDFKIGLDHSARYVAAARLAILARDRWVKFRPVIDHKAMVIARETLAAMSGWRLASDLTHNVWDLVKNLDKMVPLIGSVGAGFAVAGSGVTQLLKHTFTLGGAVGHVLQAAALLGPTLAISAGFIGYTAVQAAKIAKEMVPEIQVAFNKMNDSIQHGFWGAVSKDQIARITDSFFPEMASGFDRLSKAMGSHFGNLVDSFERVLKPHIAEMFEHSAAGIDVLGKHTDSLMAILSVLGKHGSKTMERFLGWLGQATDKYADWLVKAEESGHLQEIIDRGIDALADFGRAVLNAGGILKGFFKAAEAEGGASMERFADGLAAVNTVVNGAGFQKGLKKFFWGMTQAWTSFKAETKGVWADFGQSWADLAAEAGDAMGRVGGKFTKALLTSFSGRDFNKGFRQFFDGLADGLSRIEGVWPKVSQGLGSLLSFMGSLGKGLSPVIGSTLEALANAAQKLGPALSRAVEHGGPALGRAIESWGKVATPVAEALAKLLDVLVRIPGAVEAVATGFMAFRGISSAVSLFGALRGAVSGLREDLMSAKDAMARFAATGGGEAAAMAAGGAAGRFSGVAAKASGAMRGLASKAAGVVSFMAGPWGVAIAAGATALGALVSAGNAASDALGHDLADALAKSADGADGAADKVSKAVSKMTSSVSSGIGATVGGDLDAAMRKYRDNARWQNWIANGSKGLTAISAMPFLGGNATPLDYKSSGAAVNLADAFERIGDVAKSGNISGAVQALAQLRSEMLHNGASTESWDKTLDSALESVDGLKDGVSQYAASLGYATDAQSLHRFVAEQTDAVWQKMQADQERLAQNARLFGQALDSQFDKWGLGAEKAEGLHAAMERVGRSMIDVGAAARDANGEVVDSVETVLANLQAQVDAQVAVAQNMLDLAQAGFNTQVLEQLAQLPQGAQYLQQLKDALSDTSEAGKAKLQELIDATNRVGPALSGMAWDASASLKAFHDAVVGAFDQTKGDVVAALDSLGVDASVKAAVAGAKTADELVKALSDAGVQITKTADGWALSLNGKTASFNAAGQAAGQAYANGFKNGLPPSPIDPNKVTQTSWWWNQQGFEHGSSYGQGVKQGVQQGASGAPSFDLSSQLWGGGIDPSQLGIQHGTGFMSGFLSGMQSVDASGALMAEWGSHGPAFFGFGSDDGGQYVAGVQSQSGAAAAAGAQVGWAARSGAAGADLPGHGSAAGAGYASSVAASSGSAYGAGAALANSAVSGASSAGPRLASLGAAAGDAFAQAVKSRVASAVAAASAMAQAAVAAARGALDVNSPSKVFREIGDAVPEGFAQGIDRSSGLSTGASYAMAASTVDAARGALDINSPSKVFRRLGGYVPEGFAEGIRGSAGLAAREVEAMADRVIEAGSGVRMRVFDGGRLDVSQDSRLTVRVDPDSLRGARFGLRLSDETELETFVSDVADGRVIEYARMGA
nr:MAG TPA: hypothetical protein [Caudoviricetes sp.]